MVHLFVPVEQVCVCVTRMSWERWDSIGLKRTGLSSRSSLSGHAREALHFLPFHLVTNPCGYMTGGQRWLTWMTWAGVGGLSEMMAALSLNSSAWRNRNTPDMRTLYTAPRVILEKIPDRSAFDQSYRAHDRGSWFVGILYAFYLWHLLSNENTVLMEREWWSNHVLHSISLPEKKWSCFIPFTV